MRVEFVERETTEADILAEQVIENVARADLRPVEQGRAYQRLMQMNDWTAQQLAQTLGVEQTALHRALSLLKLPEDVAAAVDAGQINATAGYEIAKLQIADDQRTVARKALVEGIDHKATVAEVARRRRVAPSWSRASALVKNRVVRLPGGKVTIDLRNAGDVSALLVLVNEAAWALEAEQGESAEAA